MTKAQEVGDYDLRGPDFETILLMEVCEATIDADRLVRLDFNNGFPNWYMYRCALAGDDAGLRKLKDWAIAFTDTYCITGGVKREVYSEELSGCVALDALCLLVHCRQLQPYTITADALGIHHSTYKALRAQVYGRMRASLRIYMMHLEAALRHVIIYEYKRGNRNRVG